MFKALEMAEVFQRKVSIKKKAKTETRGMPMLSSLAAEKGPQGD